MSDKHLDDYLPVIAIDVAVEEKTRIAKMAAATLHKLHNAMRQMRDWQDDSAKLRSNIWRMKMALRADDRNKDDNERIDPLIVHQKAEINRLIQTNDALENEVTCLKSALTTTEDDVARIAVCEIADKIARLEDEFTSERERLNDEILRLRGQLRRAEVSETAVRDKFEGFAREDRTIGAIFVNAIDKIVVTVVGLSEELVNVSENLCTFKAKNRNLRLKLDRLRSMLRSKCGNSAEYRKRIDELNNLAGQLMGEMGRLKVIRENTSGSLNTVDIPDVVRRVERLMNDLGNNLKSDREAMIAAGDPDCLRYMKKVANLRVDLKVLSLELKRSNVSIYERSRENVSREKYLETASLLNDFLQEIDTEIGKLKIKPMDKYCRIGGISGSRYMTEIAELENIVRKSVSAVAVLKQNPLGIMNTKEAMMEEMKELEDSIEQLCRKLRDIEIFDDRASLRERICHSETLVAQLRSKLMEKDERIDALNDECANIRSTLERSREKYERIIVDMREDNENLHEDIKRKAAELSRKREHSEQRVAEMQSMKVEIDGARKRLQVLQDDKETLFGETEELRNILREKDKEIENIITQRDTLKGFLRAETENLKMKLGIFASDENVKLRSIIEGLGEQEERERSGRLKSSAKESDGKDRDNGERSRDRARNLRDELEYLKAAESNESKINPGETNKRVDYSKREVDRTAVDDGARPPTGDTSDLESNEQSLTYRLNVRTSAGEETPGEFEVVMAENKALEGKVKQLRYEKEQLETELSELRAEKGLLDRSTADANNKCAALQDQVNKFKSERNGLRGKISEHEAAAENLKFELESARAELEEAAVKMARLRVENSRVVGDFDTLSLRNTGTEDRVRVLLAEKNELTTRINEIDDGNVALRDQLNKAKAENEYFSMELNKSRVENDEAKARNALLRITCDERERDNGALRRERDETMGRLDEIINERKMLDNQLKIQRIKYEALRFAAAALHHENDDRKSHLREIDARYSLVKDHGRGFASPHNDVERERNYSDAACTSIKVEIAERRDGVAELKVESDTCASRDNKAKIKDKPKGEPKRPPGGAENKALKLERSNFGSENPEITMELTRANDVVVSPLARTKLPGDAEIIGSISKKFAIVNNRCGREMSNYAGYPDDPTVLGDGGRSTAVGIDRRLEVENRTLKTKVDILRKGLDSSLTDGENTRADLARAAEEIRALKLELMNLRDEGATLRSRLEMFKKELNSSGSEMAALKDELVASRKSNLDLRLKVKDLRGSNEKLKETNAGLECRLKGASEEMSERIALSEVTRIEDARNNFSSSLSDNSKEYTFARRNLRKISKRNRVDSVSSKNPELQSIEENLQHIEGQI